MWIRFKTWCLSNKGLILLLLITAGLLVYRVSYRTFWNDEMAVLDYLKQAPGEFLVGYWQKPDNHPPLYYFLVLLVSKILPWNEFMVRFISMLSGLGIVYFIYLFSFRISGSKKVALTVGFFTAFSSYFILISQMARYHSLAALFSLVTIYFFYQLFTQGFSKKAWGWFLFALIATGYTDYPHFFYVAFTVNIVYLYSLLRRPIMPFLKWCLGQLIVAVALSPLVWMIYHRVVIQGDGGWDNANILTNSWKHIILAIFFHIYSFFFGENIFPWNFAFGIGTLVLVAALAGLIWGFRKKIWTRTELFCIFLSVSLVLLNTLFMNFADPRYNFIVYPKFGFVAFPLWIMTLTLCLHKLPSKIKMTALALWFIVAAAGLVNFYQAKNYLNPSYFRTFSMFEYVRDRATQGQYFVTGPHASPGFFDFYKEKYFSPLKPLPWNDVPLAEKGTQIWFFSTSAEGVDATVSTEAVVPPGYTVIEQLDGVPLDPTFKKFKEKILHRPSYVYKYTVFLLEKR
jgi:4-amino-4-deoxy-L-arabinose transferase-like glycosyltransferase